MSASYPLQASFNRGEITPLLRSRIDVDLWKMALDTCENYSVLIQGGLRRRSGTKFVSEVNDSTAISRLFPFLFSNEQSYVIEAGGAGDLQFYADRGVVEDGGNPYTVAHGWAAVDIPALTYEQFNDLAFFAHADYEPQKLSRAGETDWTLADAVFNDGPYLEENDTATTLTPSATGAVTPKMASATAPSGTAAAAANTSSAYSVFDHSVSTDWASGGVAGWISYDFASTTTKIADAYWMQCSNIEPNDMFANWVFEGYDGTDWIVIDTQVGQIGWTGNEVRYYEIQNKIGYQSYRITFSAVDGGDGNRIAEIGIHEEGDSQTPFNLTASSVTGINDGQGFLASDVGRTIRLRGSDGRWRWARIAARTSSTVVTIRLYGHALPNTSPISRWALGAYSGESGFPALVTLYNERLCWGRTDAEPLTVVGSKSTDIEDYGYSVPVVATDAFNITLLSADMTELNWLAGDEDLITGSAKQIRSIGPDDITTGFSALNVRQRKGPNSGAAAIQPLSIGGTTLYVSADRKKIRELVQGDQARYVAPELSLIGEHTFASGIKEWAFSENPEPVVYVVTDDGTLVAMLFDREQKAVGFSRFTFGGEVESVAVIPSTSGGFDDVYMVIKREIDGADVRYVEVLEHPFSYGTGEVEDGFFVDCGLTYDGTAATEITGLGHLEGEEVMVLADGGVVEGLTVTGGAITLPEAASKVHVGLAYESVARTLPFAGPGQDGVLFGRRVNAIVVYADLLSTGALEVGPYGGAAWTPNAYEANPHLADYIAGNAVELVSDIVRCDTEGSWASGNGQIELRTSKPLPALIRSIILQVEHEK